MTTDDDAYGQHLRNVHDGLKQIRENEARCVERLSLLPPDVIREVAAALKDYLEFDEEGLSDIFERSVAMAKARKGL